MNGLTVIETHSIQYHAPIYRVLEQRFGISVTAIYGSDFSVAGYFDREFGARFAWDTDLLSGYQSVFLSRVSQNGGDSIQKVTARRLREELHRTTPRAVLMVGYASLFHQIAFYHTWQAGYPILFRAETTDHALRRGPLKSTIRDLALRWLYGRCAKLLYIGQRSYDHFKRLGVSDEKLVFSPYGVDTAPFQWSEADRNNLCSSIRESLGIKETERVLLFSGKLSLRKGPDLLLEAAKRFPVKFRDEIVLLFMGDGELRKKLEMAAKSQPSVKAIFVGFQDQTALSRYYHVADLLVVPSRSETWGLVVNEALHHGLPCVVSEVVGAWPDLIEKGVTGEIFETGSVSDLTATLLRAMSLVGRPEIRERCRKKVAGYTIEKAAEGIAQAYRSVVNGTSR